MRYRYLMLICVMVFIVICMFLCGLLKDRELAGDNRGRFSVVRELMR